MNLSDTFKILLLEDNPDDIFLIKRVLKKSGLNFSVEAILNGTEFEQKFKEPGYNPDAIIADYYLAGYNGEKALNFVRKNNSIIPFLFLSGSLGDEKAASLMMKGADDFLLKQNINKVPKTLIRLIDKSHTKKDKLQYQHELEQTNKILNILLKSMQDFIFLKDENLRYITVNESMCHHFGLKNSDFLGKTDHELFSEDIRQKAEESDSYVVKNNKPILYETSYHDNEGKRIVLETLKTPLIDRKGKVSGLIGVSRNISLKKIHEEKIRQNEELLNESEKQTRFGSFQYNPISGKIKGSRQFTSMVFGSNEISGEATLDDFIQLVYLPERKIFYNNIYESIKNEIPFNMDHRLIPVQKTKLINCRTTLNPVHIDDEVMFYGSIKDIEEDRKNKKAIIDAQENERRELAAELHDGLTQKLVAANMYLTSMDAESLNLDRVKTAASLIRSGIDETRRLTRSLSLRDYENLGFKNSLLEIIESVPPDLPINYEFKFDEKKVDSEVSTALYRVIQEALTNIMKYAKPSKAGIFIEEVDDILRCRIIDDGIGFDAKIEESQGNGLKNMRQRIQRCNGIMHITSSRGEGTKIDISLPFK